MNEYKFEVSFRVTHPSMSPDEICALLAIETDVKRKVGDARYNPKGKPLPGNWKETYCGFDIQERADGSIPECLQRMLVKLTYRKNEIDEIHRTGGSLGFYVLASPIEKTLGETLPWQLLRDLAELKIDLSLEVHS